VAAADFDNPISPGATNQLLQHFKVRDTMDIVANPQITSTLTTDCVSCHTETTRRNAMGNVLSQPGTAFKPEAGISGVSEDVLPKDTWNLRNFGWGFNFMTARPSMQQSRSEQRTRLRNPPITSTKTILLRLNNSGASFFPNKLHYYE
jgi:hypothetical protein